ncbi:precorrin-2 C(20)-methyltransferase [Rhizobium sp. VS19-DR104.2]|uniref:precorrin-2 C(20)-methyltransferase n=1 Tax=unclassified Rhizobium TaxID=2613769 RepID=UPI001C5B7FB8|nr:MULTISPECIES: precorrin-2 C(20)-methyltransferase [unclassified Rhizobium]MBZ5759708.1 precorrin-2 C(20)-methyltransferase [Rhizobium sp. VS19-DR96]MBZ5766096.1 precorrin-2 C(20)-methyltransferase [Rhizobium sp. VS19-DR129.2]MBZ5772879.1 precorrin-2 C(20)-methyltransferase [Rhizobium sp. VS19-DRK62.2]MBZ5786619.1 precorrin-2 C(20)-methyltransferase [Rhizobium sp. VS19-DR121]MBZ5804357.1 precorrin-2 C(20)-methyltransferase [Rhizobium sp. VS19-DR181]
MTLVSTGRLIGVGTGPGDPDLLTVKAVKALERADVVAYFAKAGRHGNGRTVVDNLLRADVTMLPLYYPVTTEIDRHHEDYKRQITAFYDLSAEAVAAHLDAGRTVAVLSEGDPMFYGSYMHLHIRLAHLYPTEVIPGITAMSGCWSLAGMPIVQGDDVMSVLPGTMEEAELARRLVDTEAAVIMKVGRNLPKIRRALAASGRLHHAVYVERGTMRNQSVTQMIERDDSEAPYFSLILVPGWERGS